MRRVLLVGRDLIFRQSLAILLPHRVLECRVAGEADDLHAAVAWVAQGDAVAVAVVDLDGWAEYAVELLEQLRSRHPQLTVIVLVDPEVIGMEGHLLAAGARRVLNKSGPVSAIFEAVKQAT